MVGGARTIKENRVIALFVISLAFYNIAMISWYIPLALPLRKGSSWLDVSKASRENILESSSNEVKRLEKKPHAQWPKHSLLLSLTQNSTRLKKLTKGTKESQTDLNNIVSESPATNVSPILVARILGIIKPQEATAIPLCDNYPPNLGPVQVNKTNLELEYVERKFPEVHWGGRYFPPNCIARHKVAIIVPYRNRQQHLSIFLNHMHHFLIKQQIEYGIFIIEQAGRKEFNRAKLMNVGFVEAQRLKAGGWQCFIFHDIDLLPLDTRNIYSCPKQPRHMSSSIDEWNFKLRYDEVFGGVSVLTLEQFTKVNGFSNKYWGWGGEDDDMFYRLEIQNYHISRYKMSIARYTMLDHKKSGPNRKRHELLSQTNKTFQSDGLSNLEYRLVQVMQKHLYTNILVNIDDINEMSWWMKFLKLLV